MGASGNLVQGNLIGTDPTGTIALGTSGPGVDIANGSSNNTIGGTTPGAGNLISGNTSTDGVEITNSGTSGNLLEGNVIGLNLAGTTSLANRVGVLISAAASGNTFGAGNVISGNAASGVEITGTGTTGNVVAGDYIGTDFTGTHAVPNYAGVELDSGATGNLVGTNGDGVIDSLERNILSGNLFAGVWITGAGTNNNVVAGNFIGTDVTGTASLGNGSVTIFPAPDYFVSGGVEISNGASNNLIGTSGQSADDAGERNVISGNGPFAAEGIDIYGSGTSGNVIAGNFIGTDATGATALGNGGDAIFLGHLSSINWIGVNPVFGPENADQENVISGASFFGVEVYVTTGIVVAGNLIGTNAAGSAAIPNHGGGVSLEDSSNNLVGTTGQDGANDPLQRNVISGNLSAGVSITTITGISGVPALSTANVVAGNDIGTTADGGAPLGNSANGILIQNGASGNWIGFNPVYGPGDADQANVIAGNGSVGVRIENSGTTGNVVAGNLIGLNVDSHGAVIDGLGDNFAGVEILSGASNNRIGVNAVAGAGTENALQRNVISGSYIGVAIYNTGTTGNVVAGNYLGTDPSGATAVPNQTFLAPQSWGVVIAVGVSSNLVGTSGQDGANDALERNVISGNTSAGVFIYGQGFATTGNVVAGNYVGTNAAGSGPVPNGYGVIVSLGASTNWIGANPAYGPENTDQRNVISGNTNDGVELSAAGTTGNVVAGDYIGTDVTGTHAVPNYSGVEIDSGATGNLVGTNGDGAADALERNILSGNLFAGALMTGAGTDNNFVAGNFIGTNAAGTGAVGNGSTVIFDGIGAGISGGVVIENGASNNLVGTSGQSADDAGQRNLISGSLDDGIDIYGSGTAGNVVAGNYIGTNTAGTAALGNAGDGVYFAEAPGTNWVGVNSVYGPENADQGNVISGNSGGMQIYDSAAEVVAGNLIGTNASGSAAIPNPFGVQIIDSSNVLIGTTGQDGAGDALERNVISGNAGDGVQLFTQIFGAIQNPVTTANVVAGNLIGTNAAGSAPLANSGDGVAISAGAYGNWIGFNPVYGAGNADQRNVISGNTGNGVEINGRAATATSSPATTSARTPPARPRSPTRGDGVQITARRRTTPSAARRPGAGNLISGNTNGVEISDRQCQHGPGQPDRPGPDRDRSPLGNSGAGVLVDAGASSNTIGGPVGGGRNVISGNAEGVLITDAATTGNLVAGNLIGTD